MGSGGQQHENGPVWVQAELPAPHRRSTLPKTKPKLPTAADAWAIIKHLVFEGLGLDLASHLVTDASLHRNSPLPVLLLFKKDGMCKPSFLLQRCLQGESRRISEGRQSALFELMLCLKATAPREISARPILCFLSGDR